MDTTRSYTSYRFVIGGLALWAHFATGVSFQAVSPILPLITEDYGIGYAMGGLLVGVVFFVFGAFGIPAGIIVGRLGLWRTYTAGWFMLAAMTLAALSPNFEGLLTLRIVYGLGAAMLFPATGPLVMQWFRPRELPVITSLSIACVALGMVVSASSTAPLADVLGWQRVLGIYGGLGAAGAVAWLIWGRVREGTERVTAPLKWGEIGAVLRNRTILLLGAADASCFSMYIALSGWLPTYYSQTRGMSLNEAGFIAGLLPFMGIFAVLLGGFLTLKIRSKRLFLIVPGIMAAMGGLGSFLLEETWAIYVAVMVLGLGAWMYVPTLLTIPMGLPGMTPQRIAIAWGWLATAPGLPGFVSPLVVGAIKDSFGTFVPGFLVFAVLAWFIVIVGFRLPETGPQRDHVPRPALSPTPIEDRAPGEDAGPSQDRPGVDD